jgi:hypothetical protein
MKVELTASQKRCELLLVQIQSMSAETENLNSRVLELQSREEEAAKRESSARKQALEMKELYGGGLTRTAAEELQHKFNKSLKDLEDAQREAGRQRELAEIASLQVQSIGSIKQQNLEELKELRDHCARLESKGDDELLIGKLQRQLMSTKTSYKAFARKYQVLRSDVRQREIALRLLETKLDQREEVSLDVLETHRLEVSSLKKALRTVSGTILDSDSKQPAHKLAAESTKNPLKLKKTIEIVPVGRKLLQISEKVRALADLASHAETKSAAAEEESHHLSSLVEQLQTEKELLQQNCRDLEALTKAHTKQAVVAARLVSLSEDVRVNKLTVLQQRRQIQVLKAEKNHLQKIITTMEVDVEDLEQGRILAETKHLLSDGGEMQNSNLNAGGKNNFSDEDKITMLGPSGGYEDTISAYRKHRSTLVSLTSPADTMDEEHEQPTHVDELMIKLDSMNQQLTQSKKEESNLRLQLDRATSRNHELDLLVQEKEQQVAYCERVFREEGLPSLAGNNNLLDNIRKVNPAGGSQSYTMMREEQTKLQEAANATVGSLRALLDEKNKQLDRYRERIEELQRDRKVKSTADKRAEELLESLDHNQQRSHSQDRGRGRSKGQEDVILQGQHSKLLTQIEQADELLQEKDRMISSLEQKLATQMNQRERAEIRCGATLKEMETMQADLAALIMQLKASEERCTLLTHSSSKQLAITSHHDRRPLSPSRQPKGGDLADAGTGRGRTAGKDDGAALVSAEDEMRQKELHEKKYASLQKAIQAKDEKIKSYREMIIRLKDEFVKSEEEKAIAMLQYASGGGAAAAHGPGNGISAEEARELKNQILLLRDGLRLAKEDVEKNKKARERLNQSRVAAEEEVSRLLYYCC